MVCVSTKEAINSSTKNYLKHEISKKKRLQIGKAFCIYSVFKYVRKRHSKIVLHSKIIIEVSGADKTPL